MMMCEAWLCWGEVMTPLWWAHNTIQSMWLEVVVVGGGLDECRAWVLTPPTHPPPVFASCLLLIRGPWRRRSVPRSRFKILSDCCTREGGRREGRNVTSHYTTAGYALKPLWCHDGFPRLPSQSHLQATALYFMIHGLRSEKQNKTKKKTKQLLHVIVLEFRCTYFLFQLSTLKGGKQMSPCLL